MPYIGKRKPRKVGNSTTVSLPAGYPSPKEMSMYANSVVIYTPPELDDPDSIVEETTKLMEFVKRRKEEASNKSKTSNETKEITEKENTKVLLALLWAYKEHDTLIDTVDKLHEDTGVKKLLLLRYLKSLRSEGKIILSDDGKFNVVRK